MECSDSHDVVIVAGGDFPRRNGRAWQMLTKAWRVVCCDQAANAYRRKSGKWPDVIIGDMDSCKIPKSCTAEIVHIAEQETNDLAKAIRTCEERKWKIRAILGATGKREDHTIGNVFLALEKGARIISDYGSFEPVTSRFTCETDIGTAVSVFAPYPDTKVKSTGLKWPLDECKFPTLYSATLNRTCKKTFTIMTNRKIMVYIESNNKKRKAKQR